jgi:hypothetical protein
MMIMRYTGLIGIVFAVMLAGCIPDPLPVGKLPQADTKIVVSSQIVPGQGLVVLVTKSVGALDAGRNSDPQALLEQMMIADAIVTLHHPGKVDTLTNLGSGLYGATGLNLLQAVTYTLQVKTTTLGEVSASSQAPVRVPFTSVSTSLYPLGPDSLVHVDYSLQDPVGKNYYMVSVQKFSRKQDLSNLLNPRVFTHLVTDEAFDGQHFEEDFKTLFQKFSKGDSIAVVMSNVSADYYAFLKIRNDRFRFSEFASEPMNYPTNVIGGYGFFNLHAQDARVFVLE